MYYDLRTAYQVFWREMKFLFSTEGPSGSRHWQLSKIQIEKGLDYWPAMSYSFSDWNQENVKLFFEVLYKALIKISLGNEATMKNMFGTVFHMTITKCEKANKLVFGNWKQARSKQLLTHKQIRKSRPQLIPQIIYTHFSSSFDGTN